MRTTLKLSVLQYSVVLCGLAFGQSGIPIADCEGLGGKPLFSLKAVAVNGVAVAPSNSVNAMPGDMVDAEVFVSCWGSELDVLTTFQSSVLMGEGATSGSSGLILPAGWDAPLLIDHHPCDDPRFPINTAQYGCVGPNHNPELGASLDVTRPDYLLAGLAQFSAVDTASLFYFRFGGTIAGVVGVVDVGQIGYAGTLRLVVSDDACGDFSFAFRLGQNPPDWSYECSDTFVCDFRLAIEDCSCPELESLVVHVCEDDGLVCNGSSTCDAELGCVIAPPPSCDDGVACTVDTCDEAIDGCAHALNHGACDDGDVCTRDECTPGGCVNIDDLCGDIPTASHWGLAVLALCLLIAAKVRFRPRTV